MSEPTSADRILAALAPLIEPDEARMLRALDTLSPQERAVFTLLGHGQRTKQIGWELAISAKTVETHLVRIRGKLGGEAPERWTTPLAPRMRYQSTSSISLTGT